MLELLNISKDYPGVKALDDVTLEFRSGEVHALVGENGAGKSTLIKILAGAIQPDSGRLVLDGQALGRLTPRSALEHGITAIYQEFNLIPSLTIAENVFFGRESVKGVLLDKGAMNRMAKELCDDMGVKLNPRTPVKELGVAYQQIVEIVKAVSREAKIVIMDEPTAPLSSTEIEVLFSIVGRLKAKGVTVIYISHRLDEVFAICERVSVLRDGRHVITSDTAATSSQALVSSMVGRRLEDVYPPRSGAPGAEALRVEGLRNARLNGVSFSLGRGEILGIGGLVGAGRTELARAIFGADELAGGSIYLAGEKIRIRRPLDAIALGIGLLPEDRKQHGLLLGLSVRENISFSILGKLSRRGFLRKRREREICGTLASEIRIKTPSLEQRAKNLSGGNQQKVVLAKWLATSCSVLIFDEPTRGIDVGAKQEIYQLLRRLVEEGKSVIMISSEMPELIGMSDRILVMRNGAVAGELEKADFSQERILMMASGIKVEG